MTDYLILIQELTCPEFFRHNYAEQHHSPQNKIPACTVPQTGKEPYNEGIEHHSLRTFAVAAERYIDVISEP